MANLLDSYRRRVDVYLRKTGGDKLFHDPVQAMEAATKQYVDNQVGAAFHIRPIKTGRYYTTQFGSAHGAFSLGSAAGDGHMGIFYAGGTHTWSELAIAVSVSNGTTTFRLALYAIDGTTMLPTALLIDAGVVNIASATKRSAIFPSPLTTSNTWLGLANICEVAGGGTVTITTSNNDAGSATPAFFGTSTPLPSAGIVFQENVLVCATGVAGAPAPSAWQPPNLGSQTVDGGVYILKSG